MKKTIRYFALALVVALMAAAAAPVLEAQKQPAASTKVSINSGGAEQLATLPGVGASTAKRIVDHRTKNGPFKRLEDLMSVKGIGEKKFLKLKDRITI
jgi:competence protein ComEA